MIIPEKIRIVRERAFPFTLYGTDVFRVEYSYGDWEAYTYVNLNGSLETPYSENITKRELKDMAYRDLREYVREHPKEIEDEICLVLMK